MYKMGTYQIILFVVSLFCGAACETNGYDVQQSSAPSIKWAFAQSYSWVGSNHGNNMDLLTQQSEERARLQQQLLQQQQALQQQEIQQAQFQQAMQQQASQLQARQAQEAMQKEASQQALRKQAMTIQQQQAQENERLQNQRHAFPIQSNGIIEQKVPNETNGQLVSNLQTVPNLSLRRNEYTKEFIDEIVRKVIQEARGEFAIPTTRSDIEKVVRKILFQNSANVNVREPNSIGNQMNRYVGVGQDVNNKQNSLETNANRIGLYETFQPQTSVARPVTASEQFESQAECLYNCVNSHIRDGQPIALAMANSISSLNRSTDPRMRANSFAYTSV